MGEATYSGRESATMADGKTLTIERESKRVWLDGVLMSPSEIPWGQARNTVNAINGDN